MPLLNSHAGLLLLLGLLQLCCRLLLLLRLLTRLGRRLLRLLSLLNCRLRTLLHRLLLRRLLLLLLSSGGLLLLLLLQLLLVVVDEVGRHGELQLGAQLVQVLAARAVRAQLVTHGLEVALGLTEPGVRQWVSG